MKKTVIAVLLAFGVAACSSDGSDAFWEVIDALADEPATTEAKKACFSVEDASARDECESRYDRTFPKGTKEGA